MHRCPGPGCAEQVPFEMLACRQHWYQVPRPVRSAVWRAWANGSGAGTAEHTAAMELAIDSMHPLRATQSPP